MHRWRRLPENNDVDTAQAKGSGTMRQLGTITDETAVGRFVDYLFTKGILVTAEPGAEGWKIWVRNEDELETARREFAEFSENPDADIYQQARRSAEQLRSTEVRRLQEAKKNYVNVGQQWRTGPTPMRYPVTSLLTAASVAVAFWSNLGTNRSVVDLLSIDYVIRTPEGLELAGAWIEQPWRLITPIFLHFGMMHIVFNMLMLVQLGRVLEILRGSWRLAIFVLVTAVPSNFVQYYFHGPFFGGMSGVLYGLFGYAWMKSRYEPSAGIFMPPNAVVIMIGWFFLCLFDVIGHVANYAHGVGLVVGMVLGVWPTVWRRIR